MIKTKYNTSICNLACTTMTIHPTYKEQCTAALYKLLDHFAGNKAQLAASVGVSRNAVSFWFSKGLVGRESAMLIDKDKTIPMSKEELRPDIKAWDAYQQPKKRKKNVKK